MHELKQSLSNGYRLSIGIALKAVLIPIGIVVFFGTIESIKTERTKSFQAQNSNIDAIAVNGNDNDWYATVTAYTSRVRETDSSPYITASGINLKERFDCIVAHNSLPFGTKVAIDDIGVCEVQDRGASRNGGNWFDVYFGNDVKRAIEFGKRKLSFRVIG
jgi:3D (Asp-Asp-Asp) domain-containing protein